MIHCRQDRDTWDPASAICAIECGIRLNLQLIACVVGVGLVAGDRLIAEKRDDFDLAIADAIECPHCVRSSGVVTLAT